MATLVLAAEASPLLVKPEQWEQPLRLLTDELMHLPLLPVAASFLDGEGSFLNDRFSREPE